VPPVAIIEEAVVMSFGASKYGAFNWQDEPIDAGTYYSAAFRHMADWFAGEEFDPDIKEKFGVEVSHLACARASLGIVIDAQCSGKLIDDRPACASAAEAIKRLTRSA
jgi:hypothetical protein